MITSRSVADRLLIIMAIALVSLLALNMFPAVSFTPVGSIKQLEINLPKDANLINVRDYGAKGDGITDDTAAIRRAVRENINSNRTILFPAGIYLISDTIAWSDKNLHSALTWQGEGFGRTIIKLKDNSAVFSNPQQPYPLIEIGNDRTKFKHAENYGNNYMFDLSIEIGKNNPGAIGINFNNSNNGAIENVGIVSEDGKGSVGLHLGDNFASGLIDNLTVRGFDVGISGGMTVNSITLKNIRLEKQNRVGIENQHLSLAIRRLLSINSVPAVSNIGKENSSIVLIDSELRGGDKNNVAIENNGQIFIRNVNIQGYKNSLALGNSPDEQIVKKFEKVTKTKITEFVSSQPFSIFDLPQLKTPTKSLNIYVEETQKFVDRNLNNWANVVDYGAKPDDSIDDTVAIQKAIDSGKNTIYFPWGTYNLKDSAIVRGKVRRMLGFNSTLKSDRPALVVVAKEYPVSLERFNLTDGELEHNSSQPLILRHTFVPKLQSVAKNSLWLLENVTTGAIELSKKQQLYAHQLNCNRSGSNPVIKNNNTTAWLFGYKTENTNTVAATFNGGVTEIYAGLFSAALKANSTKIPLLLNHNSLVVAIYRELSSDSPFKIQVEETHRQQTKTLARESLTNEETVSMPLYLGYEHQSFYQKYK
jgi:hypothetical protein